ncbi:MAG: hypothetical protein PHR81_07215 [Bacteroidales bacterium]|jgi:hypothetical protein|nr:hypothetical protein [Bacteroidales bacterium]MDD4214586.1 hypothetical protein [Bacteroidales bacterium]
MRKAVIFVYIFFVVVASVKSQDSIVMFNGKHFKGNVIEFNKNETLLHLEVQKKKSIKTKILKKEDVFAIHFKDSISLVLYTPLITDEQPLTVEEMEDFIAGEHLAQYRYHAPWASAVGAVTGAGLFNLGMWGILIPGAYLGVAAAVPVKPTKKKYFPADKINNEYYIDGFKHIARRKKIVNAAIGSAASVLVCGTIAAILSFKHYND